MKKLLTAIALLTLLTACGGGGGGGNPTPSIPLPGGGNGSPPTPAPSAAPSAHPSSMPSSVPSTPVPPTPAPTASPVPPTIISTSATTYLPLGNGNVWMFEHGKIVDTGVWGFSCNCGYNGKTEEELQVSNDTDGYKGSIFVTTETCAEPIRCYTIIGTSSQPAGPNCNGCVAVTDDATYPDGYPFINDSPSNGTLGQDAYFSSILSNVGGTQMLPNNQEAINVATDTLNGNGMNGSLVWEFSKSIGFVEIQYAGTTALLTKFTLASAARHTTVERGVLSVQRGKLDYSFLKSL